MSEEFWTTTTSTWTAWDTDIWHIEDGSLPTLIMNSVPTTSSGALTLVAGTATGEPGDEVEITVSLIGNQGFAGLSLALGYDITILTPLSVERNNARGIR
ncbi:MAG: hypothetical protein FWB96_08255 [Defluviitaleaceae bacterium]|nr:hypothetical protein [Defluviitaleaceae bacterium]MCL2224942.1 hypothetical protein [Defluviitaleaceae bacterium]MCL2262496.1 hypothetical protein [Defluviitaleaceae bacterium]